jgi:outer membrane protein TolC
MSTKPILATLWLVVSGLAPLAWAQDAAPQAGGAGTNGLSLEWVLAQVEQQNPSLKAARANWEAMQARLRQARAWEDPRVGVDFERSGTTQFDDYTDAEWMIAQELPLSGKNRLRGRAAGAEAAEAFAGLRRQELELATRTRIAYSRLANAYEQLAINEKNIRLLRQFAEISRAKYEAGTAPQSDVLLAETDLAKLEEERYDVVRQVSDAESQLNVLMDRPSRQPLGRPDRPTFAPVRLKPEHVEAAALEHRPELFMAQNRIEAAQARHDLARREWIPDPEVRLEARQFNGRGGIQEYDTGIFINLPWLNWRKYRAGISEAEQRTESARHALRSAEQETLGMVRDQLKKIETFHHHTELFRGKIVPLAEQNVLATRSSYEADKTGFLNLIEAQRTLQEVESLYWHHLTEYLIALAELEPVIGVELTRLADRSTPTRKDSP